MSNVEMPQPNCMMNVKGLLLKDEVISSCLFGCNMKCALKIWFWATSHWSGQPAACERKYHGYFLNAWYWHISFLVTTWIFPAGRGLYSKEKRHLRISCRACVTLSGQCMRVNHEAIAECFTSFLSGLLTSSLSTLRQSFLISLRKQCF